MQNQIGFIYLKNYAHGLNCSLSTMSRSSFLHFLRTKLVSFKVFFVLAPAEKFDMSDEEFQKLFSCLPGRWKQGYRLIHISGEASSI